MMPATTGSLALLLDDPFTILPIDDAASLACSCFNSISSWHFEHMFIVAALPKKPQLLMHKIGPSGCAWHPVSSWSILAFPAPQLVDQYKQEINVRKNHFDINRRLESIFRCQYMQKKC
ncbi:hypothetical protein OIU84_023474 [Salix udensis]|uniref:Uncharacterized protein n=1 Tax=Salix udensis TaxID=889485 RepID=A0AAD6PGC3_9ROSI|nr:hypothetical protein OIU84_023474 [Salix udensis]